MRRDLGATPPVEPEIVKRQQEGRARLRARFKNYFSIVARAMRSPGSGAQFVRRLATSRPWGQIMKTLTSAQLFAAPKKAHKTKAWLERAKLVVVAARERAAETAQYAAQPSRPMPPPTVLQRRRLVTLARCTGLRTLNRE